MRARIDNEHSTTKSNSLAFVLIGKSLVKIIALLDIVSLLTLHPRTYFIPSSAGSGRGTNDICFNLLEDLCLVQFSNVNKKQILQFFFPSISPFSRVFFGVSYTLSRFQFSIFLLFLFV